MVRTASSWSRCNFPKEAVDSESFSSISSSRFTSDSVRDFGNFFSSFFFFCAQQRQRFLFQATALLVVFRLEVFNARLTVGKPRIFVDHLHRNDLLTCVSTRSSRRGAFSTIGNCLGSSARAIVKIAMRLSFLTVVSPTRNWPATEVSNPSRQDSGRHAAIPAFPSRPSTTF